MIKDSEIQYIEDSIISVFGYNKDLYLKQGIYSLENTDILDAYMRKLEIETYNNHINNNNVGAVVYSYIVHYRELNFDGDEEFYIELCIGNPKSRSLTELSDNIKTFGYLHGRVYHFEDDIVHTIDLLPGYKDLLRRRQIDLIID